jgi:hypothetical protein
VKHLAPFGYHEVLHSPGLFCHDTQPITFCLIVNDFGIKYEHVQHLLESLQVQYNVTTD